MNSHNRILTPSYLGLSKSEGTEWKRGNNMIFFAGEALYNGKETATVERALGSGKEVAEKILLI